MGNSVQTKGPGDEAGESGRARQESESLSGWDPDVGAGEVLDDALHLVVDLLEAVALHDGWGESRGKGRVIQMSQMSGQGWHSPKGHPFLLLSALSRAVAPPPGGAPVSKPPPSGLHAPPAPPGLFPEPARAHPRSTP